MFGVIHRERNTLSVAGGSASQNTKRYYSSLLKQVIVKPTTGSNTYDFTLTNADGDKIFERTGETGNINEADLNIPILNAQTISIANASINESVVVSLLMQSLSGNVIKVEGVGA